MIAAEVALAFNTANERKAWTARPNSKDSGDTVHFTSATGLVALVYECDTERFQVRFNKFHAAWGDYVTSIARALHIVLSTLKQGGLPVDAPDDTDGIEIVATSGTGVTYVRWPGQKPMERKPQHETLYSLLEADGAGMLAPADPIADATMPEIREEG
jgi:hypothetical protein